MTTEPLTIRQVMNLCHVSLSTVRRAIRSNTLTPLAQQSKLAGQYLFDQVVVDRWNESRVGANLLHLPQA